MPKPDQRPLDEREASAPLLVTDQNGRLRLHADHEAQVKEQLARIAAQLAGRHPDEWVTISCAGFSGPAWTYPDFVKRAGQAYADLGG